jgi:hypothetical protein
MPVGVMVSEGLAKGDLLDLGLSEAGPHHELLDTLQIGVVR